MKCPKGVTFATASERRYCGARCVCVSAEPPISRIDCTLHYFRRWR